MDKNTSNSGIEGINNVPWGTRVSCLFSKKEDFFQIAVPYVQAGLKDRELCVWVYTDYFSCEEIISKLKTSIDDIDTYINNRQLILLNYNQLQFKNWDFENIDINEIRKEQMKLALYKGFSGFRTVIDTSSLSGSHVTKGIYLEHERTKSIYQFPYIEMCFYNADEMNVFQIAEIINNYNYTITKHEDEFKFIKNIELSIQDNQKKREKETYEKLLEVLPISVLIFDQDKICYCNKWALDLLGLKSFDEKNNLSLMDFVSDKIGLCTHIQKLIKGSNDMDYYSFEIVNLQGETKTVEMISTKYIYEGRVAILSAIRDLSLFKKVKEEDLEKSHITNLALEYNKFKTDLFTNISHELRTPLNIIIGIIQLFEMSVNGEKGKSEEKKYIKMMKKNCLRLLRLLNNIVDLFKLDSNCYEIRKQNCNIVSIIEDITLSVVDYAEKKGISITFDTDVEEKVISCDPEQIERIMLNLLSNAIKFTPKDGQIFVGFRDGKEKVEIIVKDSGIGIPKNKQKIIFDRFEQVDRSLSRQYEGSGIGLSIVKALVERHNGNISVKSDLGKGSEFIIELPCEILSEYDNSTSSTRDACIHNYNNRIESIKVDLSDLY